MQDARLRPGNVGTASFGRFALQIACRAMDGALDVILDGERPRATGSSAAANDRATANLCKITHVPIDAGVPSGALLAGLDGRGIHYVVRLRANAALDRLAAPFMKRPSPRQGALDRARLRRDDGDRRSRGCGRMNARIRLRPETRLAAWFSWSKKSQTICCSTVSSASHRSRVSR